MKGVRTLGIAECEESYEQLREILEYIMNEIDKLDSVTYEGHRVPIEYFFAADWMLLSTVCGLFGPKSNWPCIWCHAKMTKEDGFVECALGPRSEQLAQQFMGSTGHMGYKFRSLLTRIPLRNIIIDVLHMKIRVVGHIVSLLVGEFCNMDAYNGKAVFDRTKHRNCSKWYDFVTVECKLKRRAIPYNSSNIGGITRDFNGDELMKIIEKVNLPRDFPDLPKCNIKQELLKSFYAIYRSLQTADPATIERSTKDWHALFKSVYARYETPYIHAFGKHLHEFAYTVGDVTRFTQQGKEKNIDSACSVFSLI